MTGTTPFAEMSSPPVATEIALPAPFITAPWLKTK